MKKIAFYTLGCKLNYAETSTLSGKIESKGYRIVTFIDTPDIFIINTCSVTEKVDKKCQKIVREAKRISRHGFIVIIGCYAQLKPKEISTIPGVNLVLGADEKFRLPELIDTFSPSVKPYILHSPISKTQAFHPSCSIHGRTRTFLKVQDGCDYSCSFCTIPMARGNSRSGSIDNLVAQARQAVDQGTKEIVLTGVNIGDYGLQDGKRKNTLLDLVQELDQIQGQVRFRISSIEPNLFTDALLAFIASSKRFVPHFHMPLQSGSNPVLKQMRRRYLRELYADKIQAIMSTFPYAGIGADVIVGFPTETDKDFEDTYEFIKPLPLSYLHVFTYSPRSGTKAAHMHTQLSSVERQQRSMKLRTLSDQLKKQFYTKNKGRLLSVLFENDTRDNMMYGYSENYIRVGAPYDPIQVNEFVSIQLEDTKMEELDNNPTSFAVGSGVTV